LAQKIIAYFGWLADFVPNASGCRTNHNPNSGAISINGTNINIATSIITIATSNSGTVGNGGSIN
jgi:hypothetical protein